MTIAKGRSTVRANVDLTEEALENMLCSVEAYFRDAIDSIKAQIYDIEHSDCPQEETQCICEPYYDTLDNYQAQLLQARNKLVIGIYSICEANLAELCKQYGINLQHAPSNRNKGNGNVVKHENFYLKDYLFSISGDSLINDTESVSSAIRELRNYLTHSGNSDNIESIVDKLKRYGITGIEINGDSLQITSSETLKDILQRCKEMLVKSEEAAKNNHQNQTNS
jgi:hypothetical protein